MDHAEKIPAYSPAPDLLRERIILVTGASDGIGRAVAKACAAHGATVILHGRTVSKLEKVYDDIIASGYPQPAIFPLDLASATWPEYAAMADAIGEKYGRLDGLVHNAGMLGKRMMLAQYDPALWQQVLLVNLTAPFLITRACLPLLECSADASVVFVSSGVGRRARAFWGAYAVSKFGLEGLMQVLADETETRGRIRANSLNPGPARTAMRLAAYPAEDRSKLKTPEELVAPFLYLLGPDSRGVTGKRFDAQ